MTTWLAWARLLRVANIFTAVADPLAGWLIVGGGAPAWLLWPHVGASACLYTGGIVLNDCFDYRLDGRERPERPLPRGDIPLASAWRVGFGLLAMGVALAAVAGTAALTMAVFLAGMILFYNAWAKPIPALGPVVLGCCRALNLLLGMRCVPAEFGWMPVALGVYVAGLTWIARREATRPGVRRTVRGLLLGIIVVDAGFVALTGDLTGAVIVLALLVPAVALSRVFAMT